ncbi:SDR family oxidoreductase [Pseudomonas asiatica]|jgi:short-subunit dehydrogenase|uniref:SDR family oxidoreductase n=1 Tax=Pseudomonas TaxID=286 RepID=UPI0018AB7698|nr:MULTISPECIES: SDR family oxidoreductase [Pseudomonas]MBF8803306.1 SDR family oxidoreductase [Pseudomonas asiatica]MBH3378642.1 SDR family oxidoreductase [Pseudomonas asiatica]MBO2891668.1 SDR family oxidoreductase [Pseudomonas asiatica]MCK2120993.1 SDR family oxidoreductase [Pseudomonas sp. PNPG3]WDM86121.1 SDR family oxidoreductase [Pseudomonas asiatica]
MRLPDCVAVLTGASGGIGLELAAQLCSAGARVLAVSRQQGKLTELMARYPGQLRWQQADLRCAEGRRDVLEAARAMGSCNLLINAAGVNRFALLEQMDEAALDELFDLNIKAAVQLTRLCLPLLRAQPSALVVNVGSIYGSIGYPGYATYCASKFALRGFSEALRRELADTSVNVLYAAPRTTRTTMNSSAAQALNQALKVGVDDPHDVARAVLDAVHAERSELYLGWPEKLFVRLNGMLPGVVDRALRKQLPLIRRYSNWHSKESSK